VNSAIFTACEGDYHLGVAALLNSALQAGFSGDFHVFFRGGLPPWARALPPGEGAQRQVLAATVHFHDATSSRHFGFEKPFLGQRLFEQFPEIDALYYFDPDVVILCPWSFLEQWVEAGPALVMDANFPHVPAHHPWRAEWQTLAAGRGETTAGPYPNSGFLGLRRAHAGLLTHWAEATLRFEQAGGNTAIFFLAERWRAVTGDQDLLAAALMDWRRPVSFIGPEAMGFTGHYFLLSHATEQPKPWRRNCLWEALRGSPPRRTVQFFLDYSEGPVRAYSAAQLWWRRAAYRIARLIGGLWRRPTS
jgi:hypothetical protein